MLVSPWRWNNNGLCASIFFRGVEGSGAEKGPGQRSFEPRRKIISGWRRKLTGQRVPIHSNYVPILPVTLALLQQIGTRPGLRPGPPPRARLHVCTRVLQMMRAFLNNVQRSNDHVYDTIRIRGRMLLTDWMNEFKRIILKACTFFSFIILTSNKCNFYRYKVLNLNYKDKKENAFKCRKVKYKFITSYIVILRYSWLKRE